MMLQSWCRPGRLTGDDAPGGFVPSGVFVCGVEMMSKRIVTMARRAPHPCVVAGCPNLVEVGGRCDEHRVVTMRPKDTRPSATQRGYGAAWQRKRAAWLETHPMCVDLYGIHGARQVRATIVDHIKPLKQGGRDDETNYQSLCVLCNNRKTAHDGSRKKRSG
jgi:5-methylcytosine-specific restriction protein A